MSGSAGTLRWLAKKTARGLLAAGSMPYTATIGLGESSASASIRVLTYHRFGHEHRDPFCLAPEVFEDQIAWIASKNAAASLDELLAFTTGASSNDRNRVVVTIDDGYASTYTHALPVLAKYGVPAVAFVSPGFVEQPGAADAAREYDTDERYMTWEEIRSLPAEGINIGSHAWSHRSMARIAPAEARDEATRSRETLQERTGSEINAFAYPFGTRADYSNGTGEMLSQVGYLLGFTSQHGAVRTGMDAIELPRIKVEAGDPGWVFRSSVRGGLDGWRAVDATLWRLQASRDPGDAGSL